MIEDMGEFGNGTPPPLPPGETPAQPKSRSKARGVAAGVGVALVVAAGGGAVAASGSTPSTAPGGSPSTEGAPPTAEGPAGHPGFGGGRGPGGMGGFGGPGLGAGVLHGTFVVTKSGGGYETEQVQTGTVAAVSATSLQVTSKDGFKATYVVPKAAVVGAARDGISSVKKGDEVVVTATVSGSTATVSRLLDTTDLKANAGTWGGPEGGTGQGGPGHRGPRPGAGATPTAPPTTNS
ncbi:hypothetical protein acdb102_15130 [Acidothermaceae bacterium B102]|nr:hypothetical protein acdb102_15130 [Acidothermaceae bacterium B102]